MQYTKEIFNTITKNENEDERKNLREKINISNYTKIEENKRKKESPVIDNN